MPQINYQLQPLAVLWPFLPMAGPKFGCTVELPGKTVKNLTPGPYLRPAKSEFTQGWGSGIFNELPTTQPLCPLPRMVWFQPKIMWTRGTWPGRSQMEVCARRWKELLYSSLRPSQVGMGWRWRCRIAKLPCLLLTCSHSTIHPSIQSDAQILSSCPMYKTLAYVSCKEGIPWTLPSKSSQFLDGASPVIPQGEAELISLLKKSKQESAQSLHQARK